MRGVNFTWYATPCSIPQNHTVFFRFTGRSPRLAANSTTPSARPSRMLTNSHRPNSSI